MEAKTDWKMRGGGGAHSSPIALGLGISALCLILRDQTTRDLKSHHLQDWAALTAMSVPPRPPFLSAELWVIRYRPGNLEGEKSGLKYTACYVRNLKTAL